MRQINAELVGIFLNGEVIAKSYCHLSTLIKTQKFSLWEHTSVMSAFMLVASNLREEKTAILGLKAEAAGSTPREIHLACRLLGMQRD